AEQQEYVRIARANGANLLGLIDDILDLSKVEAGQVALEEPDFDLGELIEKTGETLAIRAHDKALELVCRVAPGTATRLVGDPMRLRQILINLIGNGRKFTERG